jgi:rhodanese-related sulfurtransferase
MLYRSLHEQLLTLPDATLVYPAHGAGSACGKNLSTAVSSTIGEQRRTNYALQPMTEAQFVEAVTEGQSVAPLYFAFAADANRRLRELLDDAEAPAPVSLEEALALRSQGAVLLDTRAPEEFASGHLKGSVNVGLDGRFAEYAGDIIRPGQQVVVIADGVGATEAKVRLARIGFDDVVGQLPAIEVVLTERPELAETAARLPAHEVVQWMAEDPSLQVVDVRNPTEAQVSGTLPGARNLPLPQLIDHLDELDPSKPTVVYCAGGYRSSVAASTLRANGFDTVADLIGGYGAWASAGAGQH